MTNDNKEYTEYTMQESNGYFEVIASSGRTVLSFRDKNSASHYVVLLNEAYLAGYKSGYRAGRTA